MGNNDYQKFAEEVREKLNSDCSWEKLYSDYASDLLKHRGDYIEARRRFRMFGPFDCYLSIGEAARKKTVKSFNLRYLGQSVADINCAKDAVTLNVVNQSGKKQVDNSEKFFDYHCGELKAEPWNGEKAKSFRKHFSGLTYNELPRQKEHLFESKLYSELEKKQSGDGETKKTLCGIQPITYIGATRFHMKTALSACNSKSGHCELANNNSGGEIDMFCRLRRGNRAYLTVIELKDENKPAETFSKAIKQAIAYAVFIRELVRGESGADWMELWGMQNQPWKDSLTIKAAAAMPKGKNDDLSFAEPPVQIRLEQDIIELHYIATTTAVGSQTQTVEFETSL